MYFKIKNGKIMEQVSRPKWFKKDGSELTDFELATKEKIFKTVEQKKEYDPFYQVKFLNKKEDWELYYTYILNFFI